MFFINVFVKFFVLILFAFAYSYVIDNIEMKWGIIIGALLLIGIDAILRRLYRAEDIYYN